MPDYTGGYTGALNSQSQRAYEQANTRWLMDVIAAAQRKRQIDEQQRQQNQKARTTAGQLMLDQAAMDQPPPQAPPPGAPSVPMQPAGAQPGPANVVTAAAPQPPMPQGAPIGPPAGPPPGTMLGSAPTDAAALARMKMLDRAGIPAAVGVGAPPGAGWRASPVASPELGGAPPQGSAAPSGATPMPPPPGGGQPPHIPGQMLSVPKAIEALKKANVPPDQVINVLDQMMPAINAQNKAALDQYKLETQAQKAALDAYRAVMDAKNKESLITSRAERNTREDAKLRIAEAKQQSVSGKNISPETLDMMADQYLAGDKSVATGLGYGNVGAGNRAALRESIARKAKEAGLSGADIASRLIEYQGIAQSERTAGQRSAQVQLAASEANKMADIVLQKSQDFSRTSFQPINKVLATVEKGGGGTAVRGYAAAINSFINAYARAIAPTGVATVSDKDHAREILSLADSQEQLDEIVGVMRQEMGAALAAPKEVRGSLRGEVANRDDGAVREFASEAEAAKAGLKPGTRIKIGGRMGTWQ